MVQLHMTESEVGANFSAVMEKIQNGVEVIVERDNRPVAVIRPPARSGRPISECIAIADARGSDVTLDENFSQDMEEVIRIWQQQWSPPSWD